LKKISIELRLVIYISVIFFISMGSLFGQQDSLSIISPGQSELNSSDSIPLQSPADTIIPGLSSQSKVLFTISKDSLDEKIDYGAEDTMWFDRNMELIHLYGKAFVNYQSLKVEAGYIVFNFKTNEATAMAIPDSTGKDMQKPVFSDGDQTFEYEKLRYNFRTKKGIVYNAVAKEGTLYVRGSLTKFVSAGADSLHQDDQIFNKNAIITSCDAEIPHFGIRTNKLKVVPDKIAIIGPARLEIAQIPTPLWLPFGFFPIINEKSSGLIFPKDYEYSQSWGYGLRNIGYYFPINDYLDLKVLGDIYLRGSWGLNTQLNYNKRYKYRGSVALGFTNRIAAAFNSPGNTSTKSYSLRWTHNQDAKAHPYQNIGGSINIESNGFSQLNNTSASAQLNNTLRSNLNYSHSLPGTPFNFSAGVSHSQNLSTKQVEMTLPDMNMNMRKIFPFQRKNKGGAQKWYEKISLKYDTRFANYIEATDTTFYSADAFKNAEYGMKHQLKSDASFRVLKYFNLTPNVRYDEVWYFKELKKSLQDTLILDTLSVEISPSGEEIYTIDTTFGVEQSALTQQFNPYRNFSSGASLSTNIFGVKQFSKGWFRGIRHVIKPSVTFTYSPANEGNYLELVDTDLRDEFNDPEEYSILPNGVFGRQSPHDLSQSLSFSIGNNLDMKYYSKRDSSEKKVKLLNSFTFSGNYNFAADSFKMSTVNFSGATRILNGLSNLSMRGSFDPYITENGKRVSKLVWDEKRVPMRFNTASVELRTSLKISQLKTFFQPDKKETKSKPDEQKSNDDLFKLFENFSIEHNFTVRANYVENAKDTVFVALHTLNFRGRIPLTKNWAVNVGNFGYDFKREGLSYPDIGLSRDLHCWEMRFNWQPRYGTYTFFIGVKDPTLNFIKTNYNKNNYDSRLGPF
jgi:hypothetical protein